MRNNNLNLFVLIFFLVSCNSNDHKSTIAAKIDPSPKYSKISDVVEDDTLNKKNKHFIGYTEEYQFRNDSIIILLSIKKIDSTHKEFKLNFKKNSKVQEIEGSAQLVLIEDSNGAMILPEGTAILDNATQKEYYCDSTFMYTSRNINVSFAEETKIKRRLYLILYQSKIQSIANSNYTLYHYN